MSGAVNAEALWAKVYPDSNGLVPCVVQDLVTRAVLMVAWVSKEALQRSLETGWATFYSRSRRELWEKGATSGNRQRLVHVRLDCDGDTIFYLVEATLPACHEGTDTCFSRRRIGNGWARDPVALRSQQDLTVLDNLETVIESRARATDDAKPSYTRQLLEAGRDRQISKLREEAEELAEALKAETDERVVSEGADLLYHLAVALRGRSLTFRQIFRELERRFGKSGIEEKAARSGDDPDTFMG